MRDEKAWPGDGPSVLAVSVIRRLLICAVGRRWICPVCFARIKPYFDLRSKLFWISQRFPCTLFDEVLHDALGTGVFVVWLLPGRQVDRITHEDVIDFTLFDIAVLGAPDGVGAVAVRLFLIVGVHVVEDGGRGS